MKVKNKIKIVKFHGGLGNQMFQYCFYKRLSFENKDVFSDLSFFKKFEAHNGFELERIFNIKLRLMDSKLELFLISKDKISKIRRSFFKKIKKFKIHTFSDTFYDEEILKDKTETIFYEGYWQSEKYFKNIEDEIKTEFIFPQINEENNLKILDKIKKENSISIHVRRGDYIGHPQLDGLASIKYYEKAIEYIKKRVHNPKFFIFSNDLLWCKDNLPLTENEYIAVEGNSKEKSFRDLQLMSQCKHNIIPNSSFSWWGAWLNKNPQKIVIAPKKWFTCKSEFRYDDIVPKDWIKLKNT
ncbi:MAG: alpha-1,2-fucosyltransferase [Fusobacteriaceae bacterium]